MEDEEEQEKRSVMLDFNSTMIRLIASKDFSTV
jgi:hypothetical protein